MHYTEFQILNINGFNHHAFILRNIFCIVKGMCNRKERDLVCDMGPCSCPLVCLCASTSGSECKSKDGAKWEEEALADWGKCEGRGSGWEKRKRRNKRWRLLRNELEHQIHPECFLWEYGTSCGSREWKTLDAGMEKKVNKVRRGVYNETNSCSNQFGRGREEFQLQCYSHIIPQTYILSSYIVWHLELLRQLRLKVLLKSNLLSPFVYFVGVPHFRQWKDILYLLLGFRADTRQQCLGSQLGGEIYTDFIFQQLPFCGLTI